MKGSDFMNTDMGNDLKLLSSQDVANLLGCSLPTARKTMREDKDFPLVRVGRQYKVSLEGFRAWSNKRQA